MDVYLFTILVIVITYLFSLVGERYWNYRRKKIENKDIWVRQLEAENERLRLRMEKEWDDWYMAQLGKEPADTGFDGFRHYISDDKKESYVS